MSKKRLYAIANEGRRVLDCDRVCVALKKGRQVQVVAMSGLDTIERRADQVKRLTQLAKVVTNAGEILWYDGDDEDLPPQIEKRLHEYLDLSHAKWLVISATPRVASFPHQQTRRKKKKPDPSKVRSWAL